MLQQCHLSLLLARSCLSAESVVMLRGLLLVLQAAQLVKHARQALPSLCNPFAMELLYCLHRRKLTVQVGYQKAHPYSCLEISYYCAVLQLKRTLLAVAYRPNCPEDASPLNIDNDVSYVQSYVLLSEALIDAVSNGSDVDMLPMAWPLLVDEDNQQLRQKRYCR